MDFDELLRYRSAIPIILALESRGRSYKRELAFDVRATFPWVKQVIEHLTEAGLIKVVHAEGPGSIDEYYEVTPKGKKIASVIRKCCNEVGSI